MVPKLIYLHTPRFKEHHKNMVENLKKKKNKDKGVFWKIVSSF